VEVTPGVGQLPPDFFWETAAQKEKRINKKNKHLKSGLEGTGGERDDSKPHSLWCKKKENDGRVEDRLPEMKEMLLDCFGKGKKDRKIIVGEGLLPVAIHAENLDTRMIGQIREIILSVGRKKRAQMMLQGVVRLFHADPKIGIQELEEIITELKSIPKKARFEYLNMQVVPWVRNQNGDKKDRMEKLSVFLDNFRGSNYSRSSRLTNTGEIEFGESADGLVRLECDGEPGEGTGNPGRKKPVQSKKGMETGIGFGDLLAGNGLAKDNGLDGKISKNGKATADEFGKLLSPDGAGLEKRKNGKAHAGEGNGVAQEEEAQAPENSQGSLTT
jgi:hypothetical protein